MNECYFCGVLSFFYPLLSYDDGEIISGDEDEDDDEVKEEEGNALGNLIKDEFRKRKVCHILVSPSF